MIHNYFPYSTCIDFFHKIYNDINLSDFLVGDIDETKERREDLKG